MMELHNIHIMTRQFINYSYITMYMGGLEKKLTLFYFADYLYKTHETRVGLSQYLEKLIKTLRLIVMV